MPDTVNLLESMTTHPRRLGTITRCLLLLLLSGAAAHAAVMVENYAPGNTVLNYYDGNQNTLTYGGYIPEKDYVVYRPLYNEDWKVWLDPATPEYEPGIGEDPYNVILARHPEEKGWKYTTALNPLSANSLVVRHYEAWQAGELVGAYFTAEYVPGPGDPPMANTHWIQVVSAQPAGGDRRTFVDTKYGNNPYYDYSGAATGNWFHDHPFRAYDVAWDWEAWTFLVEGPPIVKAGNHWKVNPGEIRFLGGIHWGWENAGGPPDNLPDTANTFMLLLAAVAVLIWKGSKLSPDSVRS